MNDNIFFFFYNLAHRSEVFDRAVFFLAETFPFIVIFLVGLFLLAHYEILQNQNPFKEFLNKWKLFLPIVITFIVTWGSAVLLKILFHTERPFTLFQNVAPLLSQNDYAFPSGHSAVFMALALSLFFIHKKAGYVFMTFSVLIGLSRIVAGVHFPVDILGGFALGAVVAYTIAYLLKKI